MSVVIVAIPEAQDRVNKISSEKVPHLTLMYLGDEVAADALARIVLFVEHVAKTSFRRFGLTVDRRGELGDEKADVLFFEKNYMAKELKELLSSMLSNRDIYEAYNTATQFPNWVPHLTLGFPETPANEVDEEYGVHYVCFDRLAVWTGDYDGPEFLLESRDDLAEAGWSAMGAAAMDRAVLAHSNAQTTGDVYTSLSDEDADVVNIVIGAALEGVSLSDNPEIVDAYEALPELVHHVTDFIVGGSLTTEVEHSDDDGAYLSHHGIKGMKWGVRNDGSTDTRLSRSSANTKEGRAAARAKVKAGTATLGEAHLAALKSKGRLTANAMLGDKKLWTRQLPLWGAGTAAAVGAAFAAPALLPAATVAALGGAAATTTTGLTLAGLGSKIASIKITISQYRRTATHNKQIDASYTSLGKAAVKMQHEGSQRVKDTLHHVGGIPKASLNHGEMGEEALDRVLVHMKPGAGFDEAQVKRDGKGRFATKAERAMSELEAKHKQELIDKYGEGLFDEDGNVTDASMMAYADSLAGTEQDPIGTLEEIAGDLERQANEVVALRAKYTPEPQHATYIGPTPKKDKPLLTFKHAMPLEAFITGMLEVDEEDDALQFGVKGMHWGIRRDKAELSSARAQADPDAIKAVQTQAKIAAAGSLNVVSSKDLQQLVDRVKLEEKYINTTLAGSPQAQKGKSLIGKVAKVIGKEYTMKASGHDGPLLMGFKFLKAAHTKSLADANAARTSAKQAAAAKAAAKAQARFNKAAGKHPGPLANPVTAAFRATNGPAGRRNTRADHVYNVTTMGTKTSFGDPYTLALPPGKRS